MMDLRFSSTIVSSIFSSTTELCSNDKHSSFSSKSFNPCACSVINSLFDVCTNLFTLLLMKRPIPENIVNRARGKGT